MADWNDVLIALNDGFSALEKELRRISAEISAIIREYVDRPQGEWIEVEWYPIAVPSKWCENDEKPIYACKLQCSKCGFTRNFLDGHTAQYNFCPSCGADMRGADDES